MLSWRQLRSPGSRSAVSASPPSSSRGLLVGAALIGLALVGAALPGSALARGSNPRAALDLAATPTPTSWTLLDLERAHVGVGDAKSLVKRVATMRARKTALQKARARSPMAADAATRDMDLAEVERDLALVIWQSAEQACEREIAVAANAKPSKASKRATKASNAPTASACPAAPLALGEAVLAYQRLLAERPQHHRAPEVQMQIALLTLRQARADNDVARALQALATLTRLEQQLPISIRRAEASAWLAEDDASQGRTDLAATRWAALCTQSAIGELGAYAHLRLGWNRWQRGDPSEALSHLSAAISDGTRTGSAKSALVVRAVADRRWMQARVDADRLASEAAARAAAAEAATAAAEAAAAADAEGTREHAAEPDSRPTDGTAQAGKTVSGKTASGKTGANAKAAKGATKAQDAAPAPAAGAHWPRQPAPGTKSAESKSR